MEFQNPAVVSTWRQSLPAILASEKGRALLGEFLGSIGPNAANLLEFWVEAEKFRRGAQNDKEIVSTFISSNAPKKIGLSADLRGELSEGLNYTSRADFTRCQQSVVRDLEKEYHQKFIESEVFQKYFNSL